MEAEARRAEDRTFSTFSASPAISKRYGAIGSPVAPMRAKEKVRERGGNWHVSEFFSRRLARSHLGIFIRLIIIIKIRFYHPEILSSSHDVKNNHSPPLQVTISIEGGLYILGVLLTHGEEFTIFDRTFGAYIVDYL